MLTWTFKLGTILRKTLSFEHHLPGLAFIPCQTRWGSYSSGNLGISTAMQSKTLLPYLGRTIRSVNSLLQMILPSTQKLSGPLCTGYSSYSNRNGWTVQRHQMWEKQKYPNSGILTGFLALIFSPFLQNQLQHCILKLCSHQYLNQLHNSCLNPGFPLFCQTANDWRPIPHGCLFLGLPESLNFKGGITSSGLKSTKSMQQ